MINDKKKDKPFVFVRCLTYNHEPYLEDALNGFVMQKTEFPFVVVIVNDASPDNTKFIIQQFISAVCRSEDVINNRTEYADIIQATPTANPNCLLYVLNLFENHFMKKSHRPYYKYFTDKATYWAECEGDDYWIDPLKLQKQVDYLENHSDCVMCVHAAIWENEGQKYVNGCRYEEDRDLTPEEIIENGGRYLSWASTICRTQSFPKVEDWPTWWKMSDVGDYPLYIYAALIGEVHFFKDPMSVYRFNHSGSWSEKEGWNVKKKKYDHLFCEINWMTELDIETNYKYHYYIYSHLFSNFYRVLYRGNQISTNEYVKAYIEAGKPISKYRLFKDIVRHIVKFETSRYK